MTSTTTRGLLYSSLHRFNNALENLESFQKEKDIIENIGYLDDFFSNLRSTTFVLQQKAPFTSTLSRCLPCVGPHELYHHLQPFLTQPFQHI